MIARNLHQAQYKLIIFTILVGTFLLFTFSAKVETLRSPLSFSSFEFPLSELADGRNKVDTELWNSIKPKFKCPPHLLIRMGRDGDGGKWTCGAENLGRTSVQNTPQSCVVYSFGVHEDSSFESDILSSTFCQVWAYDPTVDQIGNPIRPSNQRVHFQKLGIAGENRENLKTLKSLMDINGGHEWIDILKMDVELAEFPSLENILDTFEELPFGQLLVEFHLHFDPHGPEQAKHTLVTAQRTLSILERLEKKGLRIFSMEINPGDSTGSFCEISFINVKRLELFFTKEEILKIFQK